MKKLVTICVALFSSTNIYAQTAVYDSVIMGAGYANQSFYSMQNGEVSQAPNNNWHIALTTNLMGATAFINSPYGVTAYQVPNTDITGWATLDTSGFTNWQMLNNSDTSWNRGAFDQNTISFPDFGWGIYNMTTHEVIGDSLFLIKISITGNPDEFKKLWLIKKDGSGNWIIRSSNLDNSNDQTDTIAIAGYNGKNFSYYNLLTQTDLNREPLTDAWDITFTRYTTNITGLGLYNVTGVFNNKNVTAAQAYPVVFSTVDFSNYQSMLNSNISEIGYDWKFYDGSISAYVIIDSTVYFIKAIDDAIWKMQFTGFVSANGKSIFKKELLIPAGTSILNSHVNSIFVYPNPTNGSTYLIIDANKPDQSIFNIYNSMGALVGSQLFFLKEGLNTFPLNTELITDGIYFIKNSADNYSSVQKLIIAR